MSPRQCDSTVKNSAGKEALSAQRWHALQRRFSTLLVGVLSYAAFAVQAADIPKIDLTTQQGRFEPREVKVPAGKKFKLMVKNLGPGVEEFESAVLNRETIIPPGGTVAIFLGPLEAGSYDFFGDFHPDTAKGRLIAE